MSEVASSSAAGQLAESVFLKPWPGPRASRASLNYQLLMRIPGLPSAVTQNTKRAFRNSDKNLEENRASGAIYAKKTQKFN